MDEGRNVWVPDPVHGYIIGCIKDIGTDTITVEPRCDAGKTVTAPYAQVFVSEEYEDKDVEDNCKFHCIVFDCLYSGFTTQHILTGPSPEIGRVATEMASGIKILWVAWLGLLSLSHGCCRPASGHTVRGVSEGTSD